MPSTYTLLVPIGKIHSSAPPFPLPSWGRILSATGSIPLTSTSSLTNEPLTLDPTKVSVSFLPSPSSPLSSAGPLHVLTNGEPEIFDEGRAKKLLMEQEINVQIDLGFEGGEEAKYWTCDFSYVREIFFLIFLGGGCQPPTDALLSLFS